MGSLLPIAQNAYCSPDVYFQCNKNYRSEELAAKNDSNGSNCQILRGLSSLGNSVLLINLSGRS